MMGGVNRKRMVVVVDFHSTCLVLSLPYIDTKVQVDCHVSLCLKFPKSREKNDHSRVSLCYVQR